MVLGKPQTDPTLEWFLSHCHIHKYPSKSTLIHQGEKAETLYYIVKGSVAVLIKDEEGKEMILSYLNQGDFIGELGLFEEGQERSAWVRAKTACEVAEISYKKFRKGEDDWHTLPHATYCSRRKNPAKRVGSTCSPAQETSPRGRRRLVCSDSRNLLFNRWTEGKND